MSEQNSLTTAVANYDGVSVLEVSGEIDLVTTPTLAGAISEAAAAKPAALVIDLSAVELLGSTGLTLLVTSHEKVSKSTPFAVVAQRPATRRPIQLTGLDQTFLMYSSLREALIDFGAPPAR